MAPPSHHHHHHHHEKRMKVGQKRRKVTTTEKDSRTHCERKNDDRIEYKEEKKKMMEQYKKNQCWVMLKRMIVGKDGWALKKCIDLKVLDNYEEIKEEFKLTTMKTIGLEDVEVKLNKFLYSRPDEFADDVRLVFSRAFLYPPRTEIRRIARRLSESFEINWKSLKKEWRHEDSNRRKMRLAS